MDSKPTDTIQLRKAAKEFVCEARRFQRQWCKERPAVNVRAGRDAPSVSAVVRDVSREGMGLIVLCSLEPGLLIDVQFQWAGSGPCWTISADVKHVAPQADGSWLIGLHMSRAFTDDEISALLLHFRYAALDVTP